MSYWFVAPLMALYVLATLGLLAFGLNCYVLVGLYLRRRRRARETWLWARSYLRGDGAPADLPQVTTQIVLYNEINVAERVIRAACAMDYPGERHEIQVLDDSTDETTALVERVAAEYRKKGHAIRVIHRTHRAGFKAGALAEGLGQARGSLVAVFDADFVPPRDFLMTLVPLFMADPRLGLAQARWGHLNRRQSLLTRVQALGIDGHFIVEQVARCWNNLFMNFNGTAGMWRREAIVAAGGWQWDTLTEDLDLSYRVQFDGWHTSFLPDLVVPGELPDTMSAFRGQQFRWAKGSFQTLLKHGPALWRARLPLFKKIQAILHMGGYSVHPFMLILSLLALPLLYIAPVSLPTAWWWGLLCSPLILSLLAPSTLYVVAQAHAYRHWPRRLLLLPALVVFGVGLAVSNTRAIIEALLGRETEFIRTPKRGTTELKRYAVRFPRIALLEILVSLYCAYTVVAYVLAGRASAAVFLAVYAAGFGLIGAMTVFETFAGSIVAEDKPILLENPDLA